MSYAELAGRIKSAGDAARELHRIAEDVQAERDALTAGELLELSRLFRQHCRMTWPAACTERLPNKRRRWHQ